MRKYVAFLLRISLGIGFLSAVADRLGFWGPPGSFAVAWGNWDHFIGYVSILTFRTKDIPAQIIGIASTIFELIFGVLLIIGFKIKYIAFLSGILLLIFALAMTFNTSIKFAFDASVYVAAFAAFLLALNPESKWSLDNIPKNSLIILDKLVL